MQADFALLRDRVREVVRRSPVSERVNDIVLEADRDDEGTDFLRVVLEMKAIDDVDDSELEALIESIEKAVGDVDERYPSVRFADAA